MGEDVKKDWHEKFYTEAELKEFAEVGKKYTPEMVAAYQHRWAELPDVWDFIKKARETAKKKG